MKNKKGKLTGSGTLAHQLRVKECLGPKYKLYWADL
jgi:hypothetical protein